MSAAHPTHAADNSPEFDPGSGVSLDSLDDQYLAELNKFEAPFLEEALLSKRVFSSRESYVAAFTEFKKFVALNRLYGGSFPMMSIEVDLIWHEFILFTRLYMDFCARFLGYYLHHEPGDSSSDEIGEDRERFQRLYAATFGELGSLWQFQRKCSSCSGGKYCRS